MEAPASGSARQPFSCFAFEARLDDPPVPAGESWQPCFVRVEAGGRAELDRLCDSRHLVQLDPIGRQLDELARVRMPRPSEASSRQAFVDAFVEEAGDAAAVGNWVWFPWSRTIVHVLPEDEYVEVMTNRNRDKITLAEQRRLRGMRVGAIGLSVGAEAAVTVAQEHLCGEIVLADFDTLDLSNLNRLHAGCDELGLLKTTIAARRIARIDPYIHVTVFPDGVTPANAAAFLDGLDLLIEECDGLAMKFELRQLAKARGLNIVFAGDERGFISIEPYGQDPSLAPFHGVIDRRPAPRESFTTPLAFMRELTKWLGGWDGISEKSRQSLLLLDEELCGYPQLAGEARWAAGAVAHAARRLLLGERLAPAIYQIDLDALIRPAGSPSGTGPGPAIPYRESS